MDLEINAAWLWLPGLWAHLSARGQLWSERWDGGTLILQEEPLPEAGQQEGRKGRGRCVPLCWAWNHKRIFFFFDMSLTTENKIFLCESQEGSTIQVEREKGNAGIGRGPQKKPDEVLYAFQVFKLQDSS